jgi:hypothetical protein
MSAGYDAGIVIEEQGKLAWSGPIILRQVG